MLRTKLSVILILSLATVATACKKKDEAAPTMAEPAKPMGPPKPMEPPAMATPNIVEVAKAAGSFTTLVKAIEVAGLVETLSGPGPFTVFAPTDEAFAKIPAKDLEALLADKAALTSVLTYHVVSGAVMAKDVVGLKSAKTVQGAEVSIDTANGVKVGGANVVKTDIAASNGVIHVIDTVLMPPK